MAFQRAQLLCLRLLLLAAAAGCESPAAPYAPIDMSAPELRSFTFRASDNPALDDDVSGVIDGDTVRVVLPSVASVDRLVPTFTVNASGVIARVAGVAQRSGNSTVNFRGNVSYRLRNSNGDTRDYVVVVTVFTGLPVVTITTEGGAPILNREDYVNATFSLFAGKERPQDDFAAPAQVRGRGNSTWNNPKKPYRLKLTTAASLLGFPADRDWILLANYWDQSLARNAVALKISTMMGGIAYTPRCTPVEVVLNGAHQGAYALCDHIEVEAQRVPAASGWFLEVTDLRRVDPDEQYFRSPALDAWSLQSDPNPSVWIYKQPSVPTLAQREWVESDLLRFESVLYGADFAHPDTGYAAYLDVDATIDWYLVQELVKNNDAAFSNSTYLYKVPSGRITLGPVWDFDLAFGNYSFDDGPTGWKIRNGAWIERLFEDRAFIDRLKVRWQLLYARRGEVDRFVVEYAKRMQLSQARSHSLWAPYAPTPLLMAEDFSASMRSLRIRPASALFTDADYASEIAELRAWLDARWAWLNTNLLDL